MPHLVYWNRYWKAAGDEFSIPAFCSILARLFWTLLITIVFVITFGSLAGCSEGWIFLTYLIFSIVIFISTIICDGALLLVSLRGSITETEQRSGIGFYLNLKIFLGALQLMCALFGLISLTAQSEVPCNTTFEEDGMTRAFITIVVVSQLLDVVSLLCCCYLFSANKVEKHHRHQEPRDQSWALNTWENRCRRFTRRFQIFSCNLFGGSNITEGFDDVAKVLTDFFHHDGFLDVVPSDVVAGIVLVRIEQRTVRRMAAAGVPSDQITMQQPQPSSFEIARSTNGAVQRNGNGKQSAGRGGPARSSRGSYHDAVIVDAYTLENGVAPRHLMPSNLPLYVTQDGTEHYLPPSGPGAEPVDLETLQTMSRLSVYALAIYTHLLAIYMRPCTGLCRVCCGAGAHTCGNCTCCFPTSEAKEQMLRREGGTVVEGDHWCGLHHTGLRIITEELQNTELVYVSFKNDTTQKVYAVFMDHDKEQVVVAVRGTLSLEDCITDCICDPVPVS
jgi:hypothetical protein